MKKQEICAEFETKRVANSVKKILENRKPVAHKKLSLNGTILTIQLNSKNADIKSQNAIMDVIIQTVDNFR